MSCQSAENPNKSSVYLDFSGYGKRAFVDPAGNNCILNVPAYISEIRRIDDNTATVEIATLEETWHNSPSSQGYRPIENNRFMINYKKIGDYWYPTTPYHDLSFRLPDTMINHNGLVPSPGSRFAIVEPTLPKIAIKRPREE